MKRVVVEVHSIRDGESVTASMTVQQKRGDTWNQKSLYDVTSGTPEAKRSFLLEDDERVIVEGRADTVLVMDNVQNAARPMPSNPELAAQKLADEENTRRENIAAEEIRRRQDAKVAAEGEAAKPKTNLGNPVPPTTQPGTPLSGQAIQPIGVQKETGPSTEGSLGTGREAATSAPGRSASPGAPARPTTTVPPKRTP